MATFLVLPLLISLSLAAYFIRHHSAPISKQLALVNLSVALWSLCELLTYAPTPIQTKMALQVPTCAAMAAAPVFCLLSILRHTELDGWLNAKRTAALFIVPFAVVALCATNELHHLCIASASIVDTPAGPMLALIRGPAAFVRPLYGYILLGTALLVLAHHWRTSRGPYRYRAGLLIVGAIVPIFANVAHVAAAWPNQFIDPTPFAFVVLLIVFALTISRFGLLDLRPVARDVIVESLRDGVLVLDTEGRIVDVNPAAVSMLDISDPSPLGKQAAELLSRHPQILHAIDRDEPTQVQTDQCYVDLQPSHVFNRKRQLVGTALTIRDETDRRLAEDALRYASFHDALTSLYNRAFFMDHLKRLQAGRERPISVVSIDIDGLKLVNDTLGHAAGDDHLQLTANLISISFRASDVVARIGGDEFAIILANTAHEEVEQACRRLDQAIAKHNADAAVPLSMSWGAHTTVTDSDSLEEALRLADLHMYGEKLERSSRYRLAFVNAILNNAADSDWGEGHLSRVRALSRELGTRLGLSPQQMTRLETLARTHDLGNVGLPSHVRTKTTPLSPGELEEIQGHATTGYRIARASPDLADISKLILHHHEWWNGQGYPSGLQGNAIPIECRVLSVADAYDALTNDRPYRQAHAHHSAMDVLRDRAGTQFDPTVIRCFEQFADSLCWLDRTGLESTFSSQTEPAVA